MAEKSIGYWRKKLARMASRMARLKARPPEDFTHSWFGKVLAAAPGETWPQHQGQAMWPLLQVNCTALPHVPEALADIALITVFIAQDFLPDGTENGDGWLLRAYKTGAPLVHLPAQQIKNPIRPFAAQWEPIDDFPTHDDLPADFPDDLRDDYDDSGASENKAGTKVGGWPTTVQSEIFWAPMNAHPANPRFVFQVDSDPKANWQWGDGGVGYFGRGTDAGHDTWTLAWQGM